MMKRIIAYAVIVLIVATAPVGNASAIDAFGLDFASFVGRVMNIDGEYESVDVKKILDWPTVQSYSVTVFDEDWEEEDSVGVFVYTNDDGSKLTAVQVSMDIGSELHNYGNHFEYATDLIYSILYKYFELDNPSETWLKFHNRLFQFFDEETLRSHSYKKDGLTLTIECTQDYVLNIWLE